jgi:hypothetical protein
VLGWRISLRTHVDKRNYEKGSEVNIIINLLVYLRAPYAFFNKVFLLIKKKKLLFQMPLGSVYNSGITWPFVYLVRPPALFESPLVLALLHAK